MSTWVWVDGAVVTLDRAKVSAADRGLLLGEGVYETISVREQTPFALHRHLDRLRGSAEIARIELIWSDTELTRICHEVIAAAVADLSNSHAGTLRLRITVTGGRPGPTPSSPSVPTLVVMVEPEPPVAPTATVAVSPWPMNDMSPLAGAKVTSRHDYTLARAEALAQGADEAVFFNTRGKLVEGSVTNLFLVVAGRLSTPSLATGCLPGVTRSIVMELVEVNERDDLTVDDLRFATEAFLTSTIRGVQTITSVDGTALTSAPGPLTTAAHNALESLKSGSAGTAPSPT